MSTDSLRSLLKTESPLVVPGSYDALSAALVQEQGFKAVLVSGYAVSASLLGRPDIDLYTQSEMAAVCRHICRRVRIPVMADADNGYGNALNVMRTVEELEQAGVASITLEDQLSPKRCPLLGKRAELASVPESVGKLRAALTARRNPEMLVIARTDATDLDEVMIRCRAYAEAGVDAIKLISPALHSIEDLRRIHRECELPLIIASLGWAASIDPKMLRGLVSLITHPIMPIASAAAALESNLRTLKKGDYPTSLPVQPLTQSQMEQTLEMANIHELEDKFLPK